MGNIAKGCDGMPVCVMLKQESGGREQVSDAVWHDEEACFNHMMLSDFGLIVFNAISGDTGWKGGNGRQKIL